MTIKSATTDRMITFFMKGKDSVLIEIIENGYTDYLCVVIDEKGAKKIHKYLKKKFSL